MKMKRNQVFEMKILLDNQNPGRRSPTVSLLSGSNLSISGSDRLNNYCGISLVSRENVQGVGRFRMEEVEIERQTQMSV